MLLLITQFHSTRAAEAVSVKGVPPGLSLSLAPADAGDGDWSRLLCSKTFRDLTAAARTHSLSRPTQAKVKKHPFLLGQKEQEKKGGEAIIFCVRNFFPFRRMDGRRIYQLTLFFIF